LAPLQELSKLRDPTTVSRPAELKAAAADTPNCQKINKAG
jgi:hypothetical protein